MFEICAEIQHFRNLLNIFSKLRATFYYRPKLATHAKSFSFLAFAGGGELLASVGIFVFW